MPKVTQIISFISVLVLGIGLIFTLNRPIGVVPAIGKILNPFTGLWKNKPVYRYQDKHIKLTHLKEEVFVLWDKNQIPHIFAKNSHDLYLVQGYIQARDRLFQMDSQTRHSAGRVAELIGKRGLVWDRFFVKMGMRRSAQRTLESVLLDPETKEMFESFVKGVNHYIDSLTESNLPVEYKLLNQWPERWTLERIVYFLKTMTHGLAARNNDLELTRVLKKYGYKRTQDLFPKIPAIIDPVIHTSKAKSGRIKTKPPKDLFISIFDVMPNYLQPPKNNGSNNWAVGPSKSVTGHTIVANDTHLKYSLPNIWYEVQLVTPELNVYGASFPTSPGVVIGFTKNTAWAFTNASADVMDWYEVEFKDESFKEYFHENQWKPTEIEKEEIKVRGGPSVFETLVWTHHGVKVFDQKNKGLVMRWMAHEKSNDYKTFLELNRSKNFKDCVGAIKYYSAPAQNFICADKDNVGIWHNGRIPKRDWNEPRFVKDGSKAKNDWQFIEKEKLPQLVNPKDGFVRSANQPAVNTDYPHLIAWQYDDSFRGIRIRELLQAKDKHSSEDFIHMQNDTFSILASRSVPMLIKVLETTERRWNQEEQLAINTLKNWDYHYKAEQKAPSVFFTWWLLLEKDLWGTHFNFYDKKTFFKPSSTRTLDLVAQESGFAPKVLNDNDLWIDNKNTKEKETFKDLVLNSFLLTLKKLKKEHGRSDIEWYIVNNSKLPHIAYIPGFDSKVFKMDGADDVIMSNQGWHGATWKMVVELGPKPQAWVNYPGGQPGHPFDPNYEKFALEWSQGKMRKATFLESYEDPPKDEFSSTILFSPKRSE